MEAARNPGEKGVGIVSEAGKERMGGGIPKVAEAGERRKTAQNRIVLALKNKIAKRWEVTKIGYKVGLDGRGSGTSLPPSSSPIYLYTVYLISQT